jgi:hypothetical protein
MYGVPVPPPTRTRGTSPGGNDVLGSGFRPEEARGHLVFSTTPLPPAYPGHHYSSATTTKAREDLNDRPYLKRALGAVGTTPKEVLQAVDAGASSRSSPRDNKRRLYATILCSMLLFLGMVVFALYVHRPTPSSSSIHPNPSSSSHSTSTSPPLDPLWLATEPKPICGHAGIREGSETCEPDLDALVDPIELERWRRGNCAAPESLSHWVCHRFLEENPSGRSLVDDYLQEEYRRKLRIHMLSSQQPLFRMARELCYTDSDVTRRSNLLDQLRRQAMAVNDWRALSTVLGTAAAYNVDIFLCIGRNNTVFPCPSLSTLPSPYRGALALRNWLRSTSPSASPRAVKFERQYGALDSASWIRGVLAGWARAGIEAGSLHNRSWTLLDQEYLQRLDLATAGTLEEWKSYVQGWLQQTIESTGKIFDLLEPLVGDVPTMIEHPDFAERYVHHMGRSMDRDLHLQHYPLRLIKATNQALDRGGGGSIESCADLFASVRIVRHWHNVTGLGLSDEEEHIPHAPKSYMQPGVLYREPAKDDTLGMVDNISRIGWRLAMMLTNNNATDATLRSYRILCNHVPSRCNPLGEADLGWARRFLWNIAASHCGNQEQSQRLDEAIRGPLASLYASIYNCNGLGMIR